MQKNNGNRLMKEVNWEKLGMYLASVATFFTIIFDVIDMKVDITKLQVQVQNLYQLSIIICVWATAKAPAVKRLQVG